MLTEPRVLNRALSALKTAKVYLTATKPRTNRTLPPCQTSYRDPLIFKSFERNTVQVLAGGPILENGGWGCGGGRLRWILKGVPLPKQL